MKLVGLFEKGGETSKPASDLCIWSVEKWATNDQDICNWIGASIYARHGETVGIASENTHLEPFLVSKCSAVGFYIDGSVPPEWVLDEIFIPKSVPMHVML